MLRAALSMRLTVLLIQYYLETADNVIAHRLQKYQFVSMEVQYAQGSG